MNKKFISDEEMAKLEAAQPQSKKFISDEEMAQMEANQPGVGEALVRGAIQGATLGFSDELVGAGEGLYNYLINKNPDLKAAYRKARDESRVANANAQEQNPWAYGLSEAGAGFATGFIPGLNVAKGASLAARAGKAAAGGAIAGAGLSNEQEWSGVAQDAAIGGVAGGVIQGAGEKVIAPVLSKVGSGIKNVIDNNSIQKVIGKTLAGVSPEATERYLARKAAVNNADSLEDIGRYFRDKALPMLDEKRNDLSNQAWDALPTETTIKKDDIVKIGEDFIDEILKGKNGKLTRKVGAGADAERVGTINKELDRIKSDYLNGELSQQDLKSIVQPLQDKGFEELGSPTRTISGQTYKNLSGKYNDYLKKLNPEYADRMEPVADLESLKDSLLKEFLNQSAKADSLEQIEYFAREARKFNKPTGKANLEARAAIKKLDKEVDSGIETSIKDRLALEEFDKNATNGSRNTIMGAIMGNGISRLVGAGVGAIAGGYSSEDTTGAMMGAAAGFAADKYAGKLFKQMLNGQLAIKGSFNKIAPRFGKFAGILTQKANEGNKALAATHFLLQQNNPEYREMMRKMESEDEE